MQEKAAFMQRNTSDWKIYWFDLKSVLSHHDNKGYIVKQHIRENN